MATAHWAPSKSSDGIWSCTFCGAESMDAELFEEVGGYEDCKTRGRAEHPVDPAAKKKTQAERKAEAVRRWIEAKDSLSNLAVSLHELGISAQKTNEHMIGMTKILAEMGQRLDVQDHLISELPGWESVAVDVEMPERVVDPAEERKKILEELRKVTDEMRAQTSETARQTQIIADDMNMAAATRMSWAGVMGGRLTRRANKNG